MQIFQVSNDTGNNAILVKEPEGDEFLFPAGSIALVKTMLSDAQKHIDLAIRIRETTVVFQVWTVEDVTIEIDGETVLEQKW